MLTIRVLTQQGSIREFPIDKSLCDLEPHEALRVCENRVKAEGLTVKEIIIFKPMYNSETENKDIHLATVSTAISIHAANASTSTANAVVALMAP